MGHRKGRVTIDLDEYLELLTFKELKTNPIQTRVKEKQGSQFASYEVCMYADGKNFTVGELIFQNRTTAESFNNSFDLKIVRKPK